MNALTILVTGATAGIGRAAALDLARKGHRVFAVGRRKSALEALAREARDLPLSALELDVTDEQSIARLRTAISEQTGGRGVDVVVNNAGYGLIGPLVELSDAAIRHQFDTNVFGLMAVTRAFAPGMMERRFGRIVNISSVGGRVSSPFLGAYHASKFALEAMSDALRLELHPFGIDVSLVEPGPILTEFADRAVESLEREIGADSAYAGMIGAVAKMREASDRAAIGPEAVVRAIVHASTTKRPRVRYVVPKRMTLLLVAMTAFPARLVDWVTRRIYGLAPERVGRLAVSSAKAAELTASSAEPIPESA